VLLLHEAKYALLNFANAERLSILPHEAKAILLLLSFNQSYLAEGKIASVVLLPHEAK